MSASAAADPPPRVPHPPPRVLIAWNEQWPRAELRALLGEAGYDPVGSRSLAGARYAGRPLPGRGPVAALVVDDALASADPAGAERLRAAFPGAVIVLLASSLAPVASPEAWGRVLRRPFTLGEVVDTVRGLAPPA